MLKDSVENALNAQIKHEFYSAHVYLSMCAWFEDQGLPGFATWMRMQYQEELAHGLKIFDFVNDREGKVVIDGIDAPPTSWGSPLEVFEAAHANEQAVTETIHNLYELAEQENDRATKVMLQWFVSEQVEEEAATKQAVDRLRLAGSDGSALLMLDEQFGARTGEEGE